MKELTDITELISYIIDKKNKYLIIGLTGHIGAGKTYISNKILQKLQDEGYIISTITMATGLKKLIRILFGEYKTLNNIIAEDQPDKLLSSVITHIMNNDPKIIELLKNESWRIKIQVIGQYVRDTYDENFWCEYIQTKIESLKEYVDFIIIPDIRYPNEYEMISNYNNILIKVERNIDDILKSIDVDRNTYENWLKHESEIFIDNLPADIVYLNN